MRLNFLSVYHVFLGNLKFSEIILEMNNLQIHKSIMRCCVYSSPFEMPDCTHVQRITTLRA